MRPVNADPALLEAIDTLLSSHPEGISEYDLMIALDRDYPTLYPKPDLSDQLLLFQHHFYLRHCLYVLQQSYSEHHKWQLLLESVKITKLPAHQSVDSLPAATNSLRTYYLDLSNINKESSASIQTLLDDFWIALARYKHEPSALKTLGLDGSENKAQQKKRYKALIQMHHPDKGGDVKVFREIQEAWEKLK